MVSGVRCEVQFRSGCGYATEATLAAFDDACRRAGVREVFDYTSPDNARSQAVMDRLGMRREPDLVPAFAVG
jgi:RimJ/RimL family protein N-acetyltransferase